MESIVGQNSAGRNHIRLQGITLTKYMLIAEFLFIHEQFEIFPGFGAIQSPSKESHRSLIRRKSIGRKSG
jgi:hypothetical protein